MPVDRELLEHSVYYETDRGYFNLFSASNFIEAILILYRKDLPETYLSDFKKLKKIIDSFKKKNFYLSGIIPPESKEDLKSSYGKEDKAMECTLVFKSRSKFRRLNEYFVRLRQLKPKNANNIEKLRSLKNLDLTATTPEQMFKGTMCVMPYNNLKEWDDISLQEYNELCEKSRKPYVEIVSPYSIAALMWLGKETEYTDYFGLFSLKNIFFTTLKALNIIEKYGIKKGRKIWNKRDIDRYLFPILKEMRFVTINEKIKELHKIDKIKNTRIREKKLKELEKELDILVPSEDWLNPSI